VEHAGQPTVILAKTKKGYGMGLWGQADGHASAEEAGRRRPQGIRDRLRCRCPTKTWCSCAFSIREPTSQEIRYLEARRKELGGYCNAHRIGEHAHVPSCRLIGNQSTTMAFVQLLAQLMKDENWRAGCADRRRRARTFGMQTLFRRSASTRPSAALRARGPRGAALLPRGEGRQILEEASRRRARFSSWLAAATSYSSHGTPMLPFYIYYSIFGFQRVGDLIWAARDSARAASSGGTPGAHAGGEGLQHRTAPRISPRRRCRIAATIRASATSSRPSCATAPGACRSAKDVLLLLTVGNENYPHPRCPKGPRKASCAACMRAMDRRCNC